MRRKIPVYIVSTEQYGEQQIELSIFKRRGTMLLRQTE